jgi:hypothetical protein
MSRKKALKVMHFTGTACLLVCTAYLVVMSLLQAGKSWLFIISISGYSAVLLFIFVSLYLFAFFRNVTRKLKTEIEHPLTSSPYYGLFYDIIPFIGILGGILSAIAAANLPARAYNAAMGCFGATFVMWIALDPLAGLLESFLPVSRMHRQRRLSIAREEKRKEKEMKERILAAVTAEADMELERWRQDLAEPAEILASLAADESGEPGRESRAIDLGVEAWRMGGIACMRLLYSMAEEICSRRRGERRGCQLISLWWDGVGAWRSELV